MDAKGKFLKLGYLRRKIARELLSSTALRLYNTRANKYGCFHHDINTKRPNASVAERLPRLSLSASVGSFGSRWHFAAFCINQGYCSARSPSLNMSKRH
jgi:hypothetical protein